MELTYTILLAFGFAILSYICGSIPTAKLIAKRHGIDILKEGSKNAGGTNVGRVVGKTAGILTMFLDGLKCYIPCLITMIILTFAPIPLVEYRYLKEIFVCLVGLSVAIGHSFPLFAHYKGGKCVACFAGFVIFTSPLAALVGGITFFSIFFWKRRVSLASLIGAPVTFTVYLVPMILDLTIYSDINQYNFGTYFAPNFFLHLSYYTFLAILIYVIIIVIRHKTNIDRLEKGIEPETKFKKKGDINK